MFQTLFAEPIYNLFIFFINLSWVNAGLAIILTTLVIKIILFPLQKKTIQSQIASKKAEPEMKKLNAEIKKTTDPVKKQELSKKMFTIYKKYGLNPFAPLLALIIQIPVLYALYTTFMISKESFAEHSYKLYDFMDKTAPVPDMNFFGIDMLDKSIVVALIAGLTQYLYLHITMPEVKFSDFKKETKGMKDNFANSLKVNMKFGLPLFIFVMLAIYLNSALGLYWITSNLFMIFQEKLVRKEKEELKKL